jgi:uncharacterized membrane protein
MRRVALLVVVLSILMVPAVGGAQAQAAPPAPDTQIHISVQEDGDARWSITVRIPLETDNDTDAFERLRSDFTDGTADGTLSVEPFREAADRVSERTGQAMQVTAIDRSARVETQNGTDVGQLTLSFTWTNFAHIGETEVRVGEAFEGGWFGDLGPQQTLLIEPPQGYTVHTVDPPPEISNGTLRWDGAQEFGAGQPVVTFVPATTGPLPFAVPPAILGGLAALVLLGLLAFVARRRRWFSTIGGGASDDEDEGRETDTGPAESAPPGQEADTAEAAAGTAETRGGAAAETGAGTGEDETDDTELLSDEERVIRLLEANDGRMKQAKIVEETRWSNAKVSQLLSAMAEEGRVEKLRLGRENLISLPDED